jgi:glycosyltransferase involved in cell wall biosynthesis
MTTNHRQPIMYIPEIAKVTGNIDDLLLRLNKYGEAVATLSQNKIPYLVICTHNISENWNAEQEARYPFLEIIFIRRGLSGFFKFRKYLKNLWRSSGTKTTLIAGDPWWGFLFLFIIKFTFRKYCSLQIQLHGDIYVRPNKFSSKEFIKFVFVRVALLVVNTIRVVSEHQKQDLLKISRSLSGKICVSPIPVQIPENIKERKREKVIGIVGRLHGERGIQESVKILIASLKKFPDYCGFIIGDGPEWFSVKNEIEKNFLTDRIEMTGSVNHLDVIDYLYRMKILISSAPREGYGLTIREAYLSGVDVVAYSNDGTRQANLDWEESFYLYDSVDNAIAKISLLIQQESITDLSSHRNQIQEMQRSANSISINVLINSWINT